jgi:ribosomal protein S18 acetylase RimI-like enzyme
MTTTLRPTGPEEPTADGGRCREFDVCDNGRAVGALRLSTDERFGARVGRVDGLSVDPAERRRGRATVAVLAAEEVLRAWRCERVEARVPASAGAALALATALGYLERNRTMAKRIAAGPPPLPDGYAVRPMAEADFADWLVAERDFVVDGWTGGGLPRDQAEARADAGLRRLLPDGVTSRGSALRLLSHGGVEVGALWVAVHGQAVDLDVDGYVFSVRVHPDHRGRGHGRELMREAERICHAAGRPHLGLNVFAGNDPALSLYTSLGYQARDRYLAKPLGG